MTERPIIFSGAMVRAILAGTKTQTRRLVQPMGGRQREWLTLEEIGRVPHGKMTGGGWQMHHYHAGTRFRGVDIEHDSPLGWIRSPFGEPGDRLWVKETWYDDDGLREPDDHSADLIEYRADHDCRAWEAGCPCRDDNGRSTWRPSIHMPRWASRLTLEVTGVRVERLQDISAEDAIAEGLSKLSKDGGQTWKYGIPDRDGLPGGDDDGMHWRDWSQDPRMAFATAWSAINGKRASWTSNPWVWVVGFRRVT